MDIRYAANPQDAMYYTTEELREEFLIQELFQAGKLNLTYSHVDRVIAGAACPVEPITLEAGKEIRAAYFLERREMGVINIGPAGVVTVDGVDYRLETTDGLYIGKGAKDIIFASVDSSQPAKFYLNSCPAHMTYPTVKIERASIEPARLGSLEEGNKRSIYKYILPASVKSCQLVMGMTVLEPGSLWNTMPTHTHERRMEVYLYFNMPADGVVFHLMGQPDETRHIVIRNEEAVISPSWSIHSGVGTAAYTFIWGMAGENQAFDDMDHVPMTELR
jgi:4-deoxy-L-threo-5-hexosulose-uronate ketol-isomerase